MTTTQEYNSELVETVTNGSISKAVEELKQLHKFLIDKYSIKWYPTDDAPESYQELRRRFALMDSIPVANYGCENSLYDFFGGDQTANMEFRAVHDWIHVMNDLKFNTGDEITVAEHHLMFAMKYGLSPLALQLLEIDTAGQVLYYDKHGEFVKNQSNFVMSQWNTMTVNKLWTKGVVSMTKDNLINGKF